MKVGDQVQVQNGATKWMKAREFWFDEAMPDNIDGLIGTIVADHTSFPGDDSHWGIDFGLEYNIGVHPQFLYVTKEEK